MGVETGVGTQGQQVAPLLGVDEEYPLPRTQQAPVTGGPGGPRARVRGTQDPGSDVGPDGPALMTRRSPGFSLVR